MNPESLNKGGLEQKLELEYLHYDSGRRRFPDEAGILVAGEDVIVIDSKRVVYFWNTLPTGELFNVVVPGTLVRERYRKDVNGNVYSIVMPVDERLKPALESTIWFELFKLSWRFLPDAIKFSYWSQSDAALYQARNSK